MQSVTASSEPRGNTLPRRTSLTQVVVSGRRIHETLIAAALGSEETAGTCFYACLLLQASVNRFTAFQAVIRGGDGITAGFRDAAGVLHGHYWLEAEPIAELLEECETELPLVLDVTGDQFGAAPIVMVPVVASRGQYIPGDQAEVDEHVRLHGLTEGH